MFMEKKVVVMGAQDVAAMRKAHKEAEKAYFQAKVGALEFVAEEMEQTGKEYTLRELRAMSGLTSMELIAQLRPHSDCKAAREAGLNRKRINRSWRQTEHHFVEIMPDGTVNPDSTFVIVREEAVFRIPPEKFTNR